MTARRPPLAAKLAVLLSVLSAGMAALLVLVATGRVPLGPAREPDMADYLADPAFRSEVLAAAIATKRDAIWDAHLDPDVGRVLQRGVENGELAGVSVRSNGFGMRDADHELGKPPDTVRVVLLGDSYVFGHGGEEEERVGAYLERWLEEKRRAALDVHVLNVAISSWDIIAECEYVRRQLGLLEPDLVVQIAIRNDLDDVNGVHGWGGQARYSPRRRERADGLVQEIFASEFLGIRAANLLLEANDGESRGRYAAAADAIARLAAAVEGRGGRYLLLAMWQQHQPLARRMLAPNLSDDQFAYVSDAFSTNPEYRLSKDNWHWNADGAKKVAALIYGLALERGLLPGLRLADWELAREAVAEVHGGGEEEAADLAAYREHREWRLPAAELDLEDLSADNAWMVYGGIDREGLIAPYASFSLRSAGARTLVVRGRQLGRPEIADGWVRVFVDELEVGAIPLRGSREREDRFDLPEEIEGREFASVRFESDDYVYVGETLDRCVSYQLRSIAFE